MKSQFPRFLAALFCFAFAALLFADDFKSITFNTTNAPAAIRVHGDQFMVIRNFTQETGSMRGLVMVAKPDAMSGTTVPVLAAAILNPTMSPEVINNVVIAGPADVTFTCGISVGNCFITYKKDSN